jgi:hypothetical protein
MQNRIFVFIFALLCANSVVATAHNSDGFPISIHTESSLNGVFFSTENTSLPFSRLIVEDENSRLASNVMIVSREFRQPITLQNDDINLPISPIKNLDTMLILEVFNEL